MDTEIYLLGVEKISALGNCYVLLIFFFLYQLQMWLHFIVFLILSNCYFVHLILVQLTVILHHYVQAEVANAAAVLPLLEVQNGNDTQEDETETLPVKRKKAPEKKDGSKKKKSKENEESKKLKSKKKRRVKGDTHDDAS